MQIELPRNEEIEHLSLSAIINDSRATDLSIEILNDSDFFSSKSKMIFSIVKSLYKKGSSISIQSILLHIKEHNLSNDLDKNEVFNISQEKFYIGIPFEEHFNTLKNLSSLRRTISLFQEGMIKACVKDANCQEVIDNFQKDILNSQGTFFKKSRSVKQMIDSFKDERSYSQDVDWRRDRFSKGLPTFDGISSGYPILDDTLGYFQNSCIYYIGARTSMGKTTFMNNLIRNMLKNKVRIGIFSLEMSSEQILSRILCVNADVTYCKYSKGDISQAQAEMLKDCGFVTKNLPLFIDDEDGLPISTLISRAKRMMQRDGIDILFVDHLTRIKSDTKYSIKHLQVEEVSKGLQGLAKSLEIPVICLAQLNRQVASREDKRPSLSDFKESGSIEEDADACLLLHRPEYYDKNNKPGVAEIHVAKNRIMGNLKNIEFFCDAMVSERYVERTDMTEAMDEARKRNNAKQQEQERLMKELEEEDDY